MADVDLVDQLLADQTRKCVPFGACPPVEEYLAEFPALKPDADAQAMLALNEYALRLRQRQPPSRAVFLSPFPAIAADLQIMMEINEELESLDEPRTLMAGAGDKVVDHPVVSLRLPGFEIHGKLVSSALEA